MKRSDLTPELLEEFMNDPWVKEHIIIDTTYYTPHCPTVKKPEDKEQNGV